MWGSTQILSKRKRFDLNDTGTVSGNHTNNRTLQEPLLVAGQGLHQQQQLSCSPESTRREKRQRTESVQTNRTDTAMAVGGKSKGDDAKRKERKKEIRRKLQTEVMKEIGPMAMGSVAMLASSLSNQGTPFL